HSGGDGFSVKQRCFVGRMQKMTFDSMSKCMAKVERFADAAFALILDYNLVFNLNRFKNMWRYRFGVQLLNMRQRCPVRLICDEPVLEHLRKSRSQFIIRKRAQKTVVNEYHRGRCDRSHLIL